MEHFIISVEFVGVRDERTRRSLDARSNQEIVG
jgi:hypothetical protein